MEAILGNSLFTIVVMLVVAAIAISVIILRLYQKVSPNMAMIISGKRGYRVVTGGGTIVIPFVEQVSTMYIGNMTLAINETDVLAFDGVPINVNATAQVKIDKSEESIKAAASRFLGWNQQQVDSSILSALSGHLRATIATLTADAIYQKWEEFAKKVREVSEADLNNLGFAIDSFVISKVSDNNGYYGSLGKKQIAGVKRDAAIAEAEAGKETRQKQAENDLAARQAEIVAETQKAAAEKDKNVQVATFQVEADTRRAAADMAYELQKAEINLALATKEGTAEVERQKQAGLAEVERKKQAAAAAAQAIEVQTKEQEAEVIVPAKAAKEATVARATADAEARRLQAEGNAAAIKLEAEAEASRIQQTRTAEAAGIRATGTAEAEANKAKLLGEAAGQRELAEAMAAQDNVNLLLEVAKLHFQSNVQMAEAYAQAIAGLGGNMKVVQFAGVGSNGNGHGNGHGTGNALLDTIMQLPELTTVLGTKSEALSGLNLQQLVASFTQAIRGAHPEVLKGTKEAEITEAKTVAPVVEAEEVSN